LLCATLTINLLSAYIRHQEAGLGCQPWPACYAQVGRVTAPADLSTTALTPSETAKRAHRAIATGLVILLMLVVYQGRRRNLGHSGQLLLYAIISVVLLLAVIGPASYLKTRPAIATANLAGGLTLLGLVWWLLLDHLAEASTRWSAALIRWATAAFVMLVIQILLGAWVSANFALTVCAGLFQCAPTEEAGLSSFWYLRELDLSTAGQIRITAEQALIQQAHHLGALLTGILLGLLGLVLLRQRTPATGWVVAMLGLLSVQIALGAAAVYLAPVLQGLALPAVVLHNLVAALLLLVVIRLLLLARAIA